MKETITAIIILAIASVLHAENRPAPVDGFSWAEYPEAGFEIQLPSGWNTDQQNKGITKSVRISPEPFGPKGFDTGFTMNYVSCSNEDQWSAAMAEVARMMKSILTAVGTPIESKFKNSDDMLLMIIEGERLIPECPHSDRLYHTRTIVRAFPNRKVIYFYSFGSLASDWAGSWKVGNVMLNPIIFKLKE
jgi:hypothetical protein